MRLLWALVFVAGPALANAPATSERPVARPGTDARNAPAEQAIVVQAPQRPVAAPVEGAASPPRRTLGDIFGRAPNQPTQRQGNVSSQPVRAPSVRRGPDAEMETVARPAIRPERLALDDRAGGSVCGDPDLQGAFVGNVPGRLPGCGISDAVRLTSVSGVALSQGALMNCRTAAALKTWTENTVVPTLRRTEGGLVRYRVAAHYSCRPRNHQPGAPLSEHSFGNAIDISGFTLASGREITVKDGWNARGDRAAMRAMFQGACGPFTTAIGPDGDQFHVDHFHFDVAQRRSNFRYCR